MRELKFRAWDRKNKKWVYLNVSQGCTNLEFVASFKWGDLEPWQQFTGLLDKNGKEIYEGDVVRDTTVYSGGAVVVWDNQKAQFRAQPHKISSFESSKNYSSYPILNSVPEIIGDIYQNPELLK